MSKFALVSEFNGFQQKADITNMPPGVLVEGSQNVVMNEGDRIAARKGYTLDGQANAALTGVEASYEWQRHAGDYRYLRAYDDELEYRYVDSAGTVTWRRLADSFTSVAFNFAEWWDATEGIDLLLFVNGTSNIYSWSGGITTFASATVNTITKQGTTTWAEEGFLTAGTRRVIINGTAYAYTGGEGTTTLTGVTPDPSGSGYVAGDVIHQQIRTTANSATTGLPTAFENDLIATIYNYVYIGSFISREVYVSSDSDYTDFSFSSPRTPGEGALLTLDSTPIAFIPQEDSMYISAGQSDWYNSVLELSLDQATEALFIKKLKTTPLGAAQSQAFVGKIKNNIVFLSQEPTMDTLGPIELIQNPQQTNISDPIKTLFEALDFTGGQIFYFRENVYITVPVEGVVLVYNMSARSLNDINTSGGVSTGNTQKFWEAPQVLPISRFAIIEGALYGHSSEVPETYKMFDGYNDNGGPINCIASFSYQNFGDRVNLKNFVEFYSEGYITSNTILNLKLRYDYKGYYGTGNYTIDGSDSQIVIDTTGDGSLGTQSLGVFNLAGRGATVSDTLPPKFKVIHTMAKVDFREMQVEYSSNQIDGRWELLCFGPAAQASTAQNASISQ